MKDFFGYRVLLFAFFKINNKKSCNLGIQNQKSIIMKTQSSIIPIIGLFILFFAVNQTALPQGGIVSVNPPSAFRGESVHLIIQGSGTDFVQDETDVYFPGFNDSIHIESILVNNPELMTVKIRINENTPAGLLQFEVVTPTQHLPAQFEITALDEVPEAMISVYPVQSIYLSDYDFSNLHNLPLLFTISVYSAGEKYIRVVTELSHEKYGLVVSANKLLENPGFIAYFDNRQFDSFDIGKDSDEIIETATQNGEIPPGTYTYTVSLYDVNNTQYGQSISSDFFIPGSDSGIDMIAPGTPLDSDPDIVYTSTPYFQWFGGLTNYDFTLYEVLEGQKSADDIVTNLPVYQEKGLSSASILYPNYAEKLETGKRYAWQITSETLAGSIPKEIASDVYWFIFQKGNESLRSVEKITVYPDDVNLFPGDSVQIMVDGFNSTGDKLKIDCRWKLIPDDLGRISDDGWFVAGKKPGTVAVSASYGTMEDYVTINILEPKDRKDDK